MEFTAQTDCEDWESKYNQDVLKNALESHSEEIAALEIAIENNVSIKETVLE